MTNIIIINKTGKVIQQSVNDAENEETLYKKASFKTKENFEKQHIWRNLTVNKSHYEKLVVFGKTVGNAGQENKYEFPPPIDNTLFFGNLLIIRYDKEQKPMNLDINDWKSIYNSLFGGFECLDETDDDESEDEEIDKSKLDKYGYEKDGFVVEDDEEDEDEEEDDDDDDEYEEDDDEDEDDDEEEDEEDEEEESELVCSDSEMEMKEEEYFTKIE